MPKPSITNLKPNGRPHSYDPNLVHKIVADGLASGLPAADLDARWVRQTLCDEYGAKPTIRLEALDSLVVAAHAEIRQAETQAVITALPDSAVSAVNDAVTTVREALLLLVARQRSAAFVAAEAKGEELRADKRIARYRIADLEGALAEEQEMSCRIAGERDKLAEQVSTAQEELREAQAELDRLRRETQGVDRLLAGLRHPAAIEDLRAALSVAGVAQQPAPE